MRSPRALVVVLAFALSLIAESSAHAQRQYDKWYFGFKQGLDFSTTPPTVLKDGQTNTIEGSAVFCDPKSGDLLFYTDGVIVWDRLHRQMPSGKDLIADQSSTQAALIVPDPAESQRFYLFHSDQSGYAGPTKGVYYSVIDLRLNGGYGDVSLKNQKLLHEGAEKLTAISICGGEAYWVLTHELITNNYVAWFVDLNGVSVLASKTAIGVPHGPNPVSGAGYLTASPDGLHIASVIPQPIPMTEIFRFDPETGRLYDRIELPSIAEPYGVSFSPDNSKLYVVGSKDLAQYDLSQRDSLSIARSRFLMPHTAKSEGALKLGPDHKIYVQESDSLGVIDYPNAPRETCAYRQAVYPLHPSGQFGLPNNIDALNGHDCKLPLARMAVHQTNICESACISFRDSSRYAPTAWQWIFEGASPATSAEKNPRSVCYEKAGVYNVTLIASNSSGSDTSRSVVRVKTCPIPVAYLHDTSICIAGALTFRDTSTIASSWQWTFEGGQPSTFAGKNPPPVFFQTAGKHKITLTAGNQYGYSTTSCIVTVMDCNFPIASFAADTLACAGASISFRDHSRNLVLKREWTFQGGIPASSTERDPQNIYYQNAGDYEIRLIVRNDAGADTSISRIRIETCSAPIAVLKDHFICEGECISLEDSSFGVPTSWRWKMPGGTITASDARSPGKICYQSPGVYDLELIVGNAQGYDTIRKTVTVASATAQTMTTLALTRPLTACVAFDTSIWITAGCRDVVLESISSESPIAFTYHQATIPAGGQILIPISITESLARTVSTSISLKLDGRTIEIPCNYSVIDAPESFSFYFDEDPIIAGHCIPGIRVLSISNQACTEQTITQVKIVSNEAATPFTTDLSSNISIRSGIERKVTVTYDPRLPGPTTAELHVTTAGGSTNIFSLHGLREPLPKTTIGLVQPAISPVRAGDEIVVTVRFESAVGDTAAPSEVELDIGYNTDMLSLSRIEAGFGWSVASSNELNGTLSLLLQRGAGAIDQGEELAALVFRSFLAAEDSTSIAIKNVNCDPDDDGFGTCRLATSIGQSGTVTVNAGCGETEIRKSLRNVRAASVTVRPNPVVANGGFLSLDVRSIATQQAPLLMFTELIDVQGKVHILVDKTQLRSDHEVIRAAMPGVAAGMYTLRTTVGSETIDNHIIVSK